MEFGTHYFEITMNSGDKVYYKTYSDVSLEDFYNRHVKGEEILKINNDNGIIFTKNISMINTVSSDYFDAHYVAIKE